MRFHIRGLPTEATSEGRDVEVRDSQMETAVEPGWLLISNRRAPRNP